MNFITLKTKIDDKHNGTFFKCVWERDVETLKGVDAKITKRVETTARKGINRANLKKYKDIIFESKPLPWGSWVNGEEGVFLEHETSNGETRHYIRLFTTPNKPHSKYFINGKEVAKEDILALLTAKEKRENNLEDFYTVNVANIKFVS